MVPERSQKSTTTNVEALRQITMSEQLSYEAIIAAKLEALQPMPSMADAVWARIQQDLDIEMPTDTPKGSGGIPGAYLWPGISITLCIIAALFFWNNQQAIPLRNNTPKDSISIQEPQTSGNSGGPTPNKPSQALPLKVLDQNKVDSSTSIEPAPVITLPKRDSAFNSPATTIVEPIKTIIPAPTETVIPNVKKIDSPLPKKPRGVQGINPQDYRIVPGGKKDSSRKN